jgi:hypothetical protein
MRKPTEITYLLIAFSSLSFTSPHLYHFSSSTAKSKHQAGESTFNHKMLQLMKGKQGKDGRR